MATSSPVKPVAPATRNRSPAKPTPKHLKLIGILSLAQERGFLSGPRNRVIRARMPAELIAEAKKRTGITSDSKLVEAALANIALEDNYGEWLHAHRGTVDPDLDLEF